MIQFFETYRHNVIVSTLLTQIGWSNHLLILSSTKTIEEKEFYIRLCIKNNYSYRELNRQISSGYFERYLLSTSLTGIISQTLAKKLCKTCRVKRKTTEYEKMLFKKALGKDVDEVYEAGKKCNNCTSGYSSTRSSYVK